MGTLPSHHASLSAELPGPPLPGSGTATARRGPLGITIPSLSAPASKRPLGSRVTTALRTCLALSIPLSLPSCPLFWASWGERRGRQAPGRGGAAAGCCPSPSAVVRAGRKFSQLLRSHFLFLNYLPFLLLESLRARQNNPLSCCLYLSDVCGLLSHSLPSWSHFGEILQPEGPSLSSSTGARSLSWALLRTISTTHPPPTPRTHSQIFNTHSHSHTLSYTHILTYTLTHSLPWPPLHPMGMMSHRHLTLKPGGRFDADRGGVPKDLGICLSLCLTLSCVILIRCV